MRSRDTSAHPKHAAGEGAGSLKQSNEDSQYPHDFPKAHPKSTSVPADHYDHDGSDAVDPNGESLC